MTATTTSTNHNHFYHQHHNHHHQWTPWCTVPRRNYTVKDRCRRRRGRHRTAARTLSMVVVVVAWMVVMVVVWSIHGGDPDRSRVDRTRSPSRTVGPRWMDRTPTATIHATRRWECVRASMHSSIPGVVGTYASSSSSSSNVSTVDRRPPCISPPSTPWAPIPTPRTFPSRPRRFRPIHIHMPIHSNNNKNNSKKNNIKNHYNNNHHHYKNRVAPRSDLQIVAPPVVRRVLLKSPLVPTYRPCIQSPPSTNSNYNYDNNSSCNNNSCNSSSSSCSHVPSTLAWTPIRSAVNCSRAPRSWSSYTCTMPNQPRPSSISNSWPTRESSGSISPLNWFDTDSNVSPNTCTHNWNPPASPSGGGASS